MPNPLGPLYSFEFIVCIGAVLLVLFTAGSVFGLVAMVWWFVSKNDMAAP